MDPNPPITDHLDAASWEAPSEAPQEEARRGPHIPRSARRARKRRVAKAFTKAAYKDPRTALALGVLDSETEDWHYYLPPSQEPYTLGEPVRIRLEGTHANGYHVLEGEPTPSMLMAKSTVAALSKEWGLTEAAWVRVQGWRDVLEVSHSEGVLCYELHPLAWADEGPDTKYLLAVLIGTKGPEARAPKDRPRDLGPTVRVLDANMEETLP
ncbi:hypothetical protein SEA_WIDOW_63 [Gordonia phage Widow]|nr:hypothetical protein SEA_WIDOW_63 [Gordonia phage Widow]